MFQEEVTLTFVFQTIAVILVIIAIGIYYVKKKAKEVK
jgi:flagellar biogenesis protein FliO